MTTVSRRLEKSLVVMACICSISINASNERRDVTYNNTRESFEVIDNGQAHQVKREFLDRQIRDIDPSEVIRAYRSGLISLRPTEIQGDNGLEFGIASHAKGKGGGPIVGAIGYWGTKLIGYGIVVSGFKQIVKSTLSADDIAPKKGSKKRTVYDGAIQVAESAFMASGVGSNVAVVSAISNTITKLGGGPISAVAVVGHLTVSGPVPVEAASTSVGVFLTAVPFLP